MQKRDRMSSNSHPRDTGVPNDSPLSKRREGNATPPPEVVAVVPQEEEEIDDMAFARRLMEEELGRADDVGLDLPEELRESLSQLSPRTRLEVMRDIAQQRQAEAMANQWANQAPPEAEDDVTTTSDTDDVPSEANDGGQAALMAANFGELFQLLGQGGLPGGVGGGGQGHLMLALRNLQHIMAQRMAGLDDNDVDNYSYEQLLELEERIGKVSTGVRPSEMGSLTAHVYARPMGDAEGEEHRCSICLDAYTDGDAVTSLPCKHTFHGGCIETWASENNSCPMCKQEIAQRN